MLIQELKNKDGRKSELREGVSGSGRTVYFIQWESGHQDGPFSSKEEAKNYGVYS